MSTYVCQICGYAYDENDNPPFDSLPDDWQCPLCGAPKSQFEKEGDAPEISDKATTPPVEHSPQETVNSLSDDPLRQLTAGELSALCSNLARGCEKQYKPEQAALFAELSDYYARQTPTSGQASFDALNEAGMKDLPRYPQAGELAKSDGDRGAMRVLVWSEKVTKILTALLTRYEKEGAAILDGTKLWVCDICGFVVVGDEPPAVCPICKVPGFKILEVR